MSTSYSAAILRGWRFTYDDLIEMLEPSDTISRLFDTLYDTDHFYRDNCYWDDDQCSYYLGIKLVERDLWDTNEPFNLNNLEYNDNMYNKLSRIWIKAFPKLDMPPTKYYLFPIIG